MTEPGPSESLIGVDTGGTFTDVILRESTGRVRVHKLLSTPSDPSQAIADGVARVRAGNPPHIVHGTTVATNALLERQGARVAFVTTAGFEDVLALRRQNRPELYKFHIELPAPLVAAADCFGVSERLAYDGDVLEALDERALDDLVARLVDEPFDAVSVCLLHAYANPAHERRVGQAIREALPEAHVSLSHEILREFREYERASTTAVNAFVGPVMAHYLTALRRRVDAGRIEILQSSGGRCELDYAARFPVHTVLSGPAGGVVGALSAAREVDIERIITFDMGGTSTDVSLCDGDVLLTSEAEIGGLPIHVPVIDIHTVGAGGGSIAYADPGGALRVGPRSAGADPGPACYGRGGQEPAVTDAHVFLGRVRPDRFLGGDMNLSPQASRAAIERLAHTLGLGAEETAHGVLDVADATMVRAIKVISLEKGYDPREFCLVAFGGAGGMHACRLAATLDIPRVLVPRTPGLLSAYGMLNADSQRLYGRSLLRPLAQFVDGGDAVEQMRDELAALAERARVDLTGDEASAGVELEWSLDLRYQGQSFEIGVPVDWSAGSDVLGDPTEEFERRHERLYGYRAEGRPVELVTLRLRAYVPAAHPPLGEVQVAGADAEALAERTRAEVGFKQGTFSTPIVARPQLDEGEAFDGPAVITEYSGTTVVPPGWRVQVTCGHLLLTHLEQAEEGR